MPNLLRIYRIFILSILNLLFLLLGAAIETAFFLRKDLKMRIKARCMVWWARSCCSVLGIYITPTGTYDRDKIFFIISNHCSYIDILVIGSIMPSVFISKKEVDSWPLLGSLARLAGTIFVNRESKTASVKALEEIQERLRNGISVVAFPEGTTNDGLHIKAFKSTFFKAPINTKSPILPISLIYSGLNGSPVGHATRDMIAWHDAMHFLPHFWELMGIKRIDVRIHFNPQIHDVAQDRKALSAVAHERIKAGHSFLSN
ncbi:MAG: 1-acyl-sn-glycerol-3-phosphate acyltransferase [Nitrospirae bacterium]|nr:1-acyl-sn-glycerol-3-phosphate acyltransferase [Nitrospirota bacterium]